MRKFLLVIALPLFLLAGSAEGKPVSPALKKERAKFIREAKRSNQIINQISNLVASSVSGETRLTLEEENLCFRDIITSASPQNEIKSAAQLQRLAIYSQIMKDVDPVALEKLLQGGEGRLRGWWRWQKEILLEYQAISPLLACPALERWSAERYVGLNEITNEIYGDEFVSSFVHKTELRDWYSSNSLWREIRKMRWSSMRIPRAVAKLRKGVLHSVLQRKFYFLAQGGFFDPHAL